MDKSQPSDGIFMNIKVEFEQKKKSGRGWLNGWNGCGILIKKSKYGNSHFIKPSAMLQHDIITCKHEHKF